MNQSISNKKSERGWKERAKAVDERGWKSGGVRQSLPAESARLAVNIEVRWKSFATKELLLQITGITGRRQAYPATLASWPTQRPSMHYKWVEVGESEKLDRSCARLCAYSPQVLWVSSEESEFGDNLWLPSGTSPSARQMGGLQRRRRWCVSCGPAVAVQTAWRIGRLALKKNKTCAFQKMKKKMMRGPRSCDLVLFTDFFLWHWCTMSDVWLQAIFDDQQITAACQWHFSHIFGFLLYLVNSVGLRHFHNFFFLCLQSLCCEVLLYCWNKKNVIRSGGSSVIMQNRVKI